MGFHTLRRYFHWLGTAAFIAAFALPAAAQQSTTTPSSPITLRPGDILRVRVWPDSALSGEFPIEETGKAVFPLAGELDVAGHTIADIRRMLMEKYNRPMKAPVIQVTPLFRVSILGAVERPGLYHIDPTQTLFDLISLAGGFRRDAKEEKLKIIREDGVVELNAERTLKEGGAALNLALRPGDRVIVPESSGFSAQSVFFVIQSIVVITTLLTRN
jgi:polysaccharide export outer membrane protein